jgi:hypothetical protein
MSYRYWLHQSIQQDFNEGGTEVFGEGVAISESSNKKLKTLAELNMKSLFGDLTDSEEEERQKLKVIFPTENALINHD